MLFPFLKEFSMSTLDTLTFESDPFHLSGFEHPLVLQILTYPKSEKFAYRIAQVEPGVGPRCVQGLVWAEPGPYPRTFNLSMYVENKNVEREHAIEAYSRDYDEFVTLVGDLARDSLNVNRAQKVCFEEGTVTYKEFVALHQKVTGHLNRWASSPMTDQFFPFG